MAVPLQNESPPCAGVVLACYSEWLYRRLSMSFQPAIVDAYVRSTAIFMRAAVCDTGARDNTVHLRGFRKSFINLIARDPLSPRERGRNQNHSPLPGERVPDGGGRGPHVLQVVGGEKSFSTLSDFDGTLHNFGPRAVNPV